MIFILCIIFKIATLTEIGVLRQVMSEEMRHDYSVNAVILSYVFLGCFVAVLLVSFSLFLVQLSRETARLREEERLTRGRRLRELDTGRMVRLLPLAGHLKYHLFLSHVWSTGQDQMRIVKQRLLEMVPEIRVFLDVDDLKEGRGSEDVEVSQHVLIFISRGYFSSPNCMRECLKAMAESKPIIALIEPQSDKGGVSKLEVRESLRKAVSSFHQWGLANEMQTWGFAVPTADEVYDFLFSGEILEWARISENLGSPSFYTFLPILRIECIAFYALRHSHLTFGFVATCPVPRRVPRCHLACNCSAICCSPCG